MIIVYYSRLLCLCGDICISGSDNMTGMIWFIKILAAFFVSLLDGMAYTLLNAGYNVFYAVSRIDIFGTDGEKLYIMK